MKQIQIVMQTLVFSGVVTAILMAAHIGKSEAKEPNHELFLPHALESTSILSTATSRISPHLVPQLSLYGHYARDPVILMDEQRHVVTQVVAHQTKLDLGFGVGFFDYVSVGLSLPLILYVDGGKVTSNSLSYNTASYRPQIIVSNPRLDLRVRFFTINQFGMGLDLLAFLGAHDINLLAINQESLRTSLVFDYVDETSKIPYKLALNLGWLTGGDDHLGETTRKIEQVPNVGKLTLSIAAEVSFFDKSLSLLLDAYSRIDVLVKYKKFSDYIATEAMLAAKYRFGKTGLNVTVGGGLGLSSGFGSSSYRVLLALGYSPALPEKEIVEVPLNDEIDPCAYLPEDVKPSCYNSFKEEEKIDHDGINSLKDQDGDKIPDSDDLCIDIAEDFDGFEDEDGCPELDNDGDGINDADDACPNEMGDVEHQGCPIQDRDGDGVEDDVDQCPDLAEPNDEFKTGDGCPNDDIDNDGIKNVDDKCPRVPSDGLSDDGCPSQQKSSVRLVEDRIEILEAIYFDIGRSSVKKESLPVLKQVAAVLISHPEIKVIRVEGHTDSVGNKRKNLELSQQRAAAVKEYLIERGVDGHRISARGYGDSHPIAFEKTKEARAKNRRVEFHIIERAK